MGNKGCESYVHQLYIVSGLHSPRPKHSEGNPQIALASVKSAAGQLAGVNVVITTGNFVLYSGPWPTTRRWVCPELRQEIVLHLVPIILDAIRSSLALLRQRSCVKGL